jgi:hypothetical protein
MRVIVRQTSGLGNQLFQYAAGKFVAKKFGGELHIAAQLPQLQQSHGHLRPFLLSRFAISAKVNSISTYDRVLLTTRPSLAWYADVLRSALNIQVIREAPQCQFKYPEFRVSRSSKVVYLVGYWQAYQLVDGVEAELRSELLLRDDLSGRNLEVAGLIGAAKTPVSVHLRRGDYAKVFGASSMLSSEYYDRAVRYMRDRFEDPTFFVFSDDSAYARNWAAAHESCIVVDHNDAESAHEDMRLMSLCRHHIIANSSFSWWGAWMNTRQDKQILAPTRWLPDIATRDRDIAPPGWVLFDA